MNEEILIEELIRFIAGIERKMSRRELIEYNSIVSSYLLNQDSLMIDRASAKKSLLKPRTWKGTSSQL